MIKRILIFLLLTTCYLLLTTNVNAKDFSSFYKTTYKFDQKGDAWVTQEVSLVNQTADLYVSEYTLSIVGGQIDNIEAFDRIGSLKLQTLLKGTNTLITLHFNEQVVGKEKTLSFVLKYRSLDMAKKEGNLWQISLPKLAQPEEIDEYQLFLRIPTGFGKIAFVNPSPRAEEVDDGYIQLKFDKDDLINYGVLATVGQYQTFNFKLNYNLSNPTSSSRMEKIALPPDTNYQTVYYQKLNPEPLNVEIDSDGNWLAIYKLSPKEKLSVNVQGQADIFFQSKTVKSAAKSFFKDDYLTPTRYWPTANSQIKELAAQLKTPENIYRFVTSHLSYDYQSVKKGAARRETAEILKEPARSICTDFTDLFISLARAAGIPSRELAGYAYTDNPKLLELAKSNDVLHSWPEYFDDEKKEWIMVDPTWENTSGGVDYFHKFDMSHFVFVIHGQSDTLPLSAGAYKENESQEKQVFVSLGKEDALIKPKTFSLEKINPRIILSLRKNKITVEMKNKSGFAFYNEIVRAQSKAKLTPNEWLFQVVPPYGLFKATFSLQLSEVLKDYPLAIVFKIGEEEESLSLHVNSLLLRASLLVAALLTLVIVSLLWSSRRRSTFNLVKKNGKLES